MKVEKYLKKLGERIANRRKELGLSQENLAKQLGVHRTAVTRIELGNTNTSIGGLRLIASVLKVKLSELVDIED